RLPGFAACWSTIWIVGVPWSSTIWTEKSLTAAATRASRCAFSSSRRSSCSNCSFRRPDCVPPLRGRGGELRRVFFLKRLAKLMPITPADASDHCKICGRRTEKEWLRSGGEGGTEGRREDPLLEQTLALQECPRDAVHVGEG